MEVGGEFGIGEVRINSHLVNGPHRIVNAVEIANVVVIQLASYAGYENETSDFELDDPARNLVALDSNADVIWIVSDPPRNSGSLDANYYEYLYTLLGDLYARDVEKRLYEIKPTNGEVEQSFDKGILPIADKQVLVDGWISKAIEFDDKIFLRTGEAEHHSLYGFDSDGVELWKSEERRGMIYKDGERLIEKRQRGPRTEEFYRLDKDTGDRIAEIEVENTPDGWVYLRDVADEE